MHHEVLDISITLYNWLEHISNTLQKVDTVNLLKEVVLSTGGLPSRGSKNVFVSTASQL